LAKSQQFFKGGIMQRAIYDTDNGRKIYPGLYPKKRSEKLARKITQKLLCSMFESDKDKKSIKRR
jgi:hypothetical protein